MPGVGMGDGAHHQPGDHHDDGVHQPGDYHGIDERTDDHEDVQLGTSVERATVELSSDGGYHFVPHVVRVVPGGTVEWVLASGAHDVVAYHPDNDRVRRTPAASDGFRSPLFSADGETFTSSFAREGVYDYYCTPHEALGMVGRVVVGEPVLDDEPAMVAGDDDLPRGAADRFREYDEAVRTALDD